MEESLNEEKFDYKKLSEKKQYVWKVCKRILRDLKDGRCSDEEIDDLIASTEPRIRGYFREEDYVSADQAMEILHLGKNRNKLFRMLKIHKIEAKSFKGVKIGYYINDIYKLKSKL